VATRPATSDPGWVTLTEACRLLGVSPSTVRRWADSGLVRTFVTPGGHRRFSRTGLEALLPERPPSRQNLAEMGGTPGRMARGYRKAADDDRSRLPWMAELDDTERERYRRYGRTIVTSLVEALSTDDQRKRTDRLRDAEDACTEYGRISARQGLGAPMTADTFLRYRRPFLAELAAIARRRELDASATAALIEDANAALDGLLLASLRGWESAALAAARPARAARAPRSSRPSAPSSGSSS
jgi:excisionase family DNA binding protein